MESDIKAMFEYLIYDTSTGIDADASKGKTQPGLFWQPVGLII